ncbi:MAG: leucine-rich repeat domain-containing protein [Oscillospiraceae bacterium]|nr:leucine-rich repeat domain-containing protein [Oscillospiraceae bacterium]
MKRKMKNHFLRKLILCAVLTAVTVFLSACGCSAAENDLITRGEWIALLGRSFELTTYQQETPYYTDVPADHAVFSYVQAGYEWEILRSDGAFDPNEPATRGFVAQTAILAALGDYDASVQELDTNTLLRLAVDYGIVSSGKSGDKMTASDCTRAIVSAIECRLNYEMPEYADITVKDTVVDYGASAEVSVENGTVVMPNDMGAEIEVGTVFIVPGEPYGTAVKAASVKTVSGQTVIETVTPEIAEVFENVSFSFTASPELEDILPLQSGITITPAGSAGASLSGGFSTNSPFVTLSTGMRARGKKDAISFDVDFNIANGTLKTDPAYAEYSQNAADRFAQLFGSALSDEALEALKSTQTAIGQDGSAEKIPRYTGGYEITGSLSVKNLYAKASCKENLSAFTCELHFEVESSLEIRGVLEGAIPIYETVIAGPNGICVKVIFSIYADMNGEAVIGAEIAHTASLSYRSKNFKTVQDTAFTPSGALCAGFSSGVKAEAIPTVWGLPMIDVSAKVGTDVDVSALYRHGGNIPVICVDANAYSPVVSLAVGENVKTLANKIGIVGDFTLVDRAGAPLTSDCETLWHWEITAESAKLVEKCTYGGIDPQDPTDPPTEPTTEPPTEPTTEPPTEPLSPSEGLSYKVYDNYCVVSGIGTCKDTDIVIPDTYNGLPITEIDGFAFRGNATLKSVVIPDSVTKIGRCAFQECSSLESITLPNSITNIEDSAFSFCGFKNITLPDNLTSISNGLFYYCTNLTSITIPNSVTSIGDSAFSVCTGLKSIEIPYGVKNIEYGVFSSCASLTSVTIPDSVASVGGSAFSGCTSLVSIELPDSVRTIGDGAFSGCTNLVSIIIPNSVTSIAECTFAECTSLVSIAIPDRVTNIGNRAFLNCTSLVSIKIPSNVKTIDYSTFEGCTGLKSIVLPESLVGIGREAFLNCISLDSIKIPRNVNKIDYSAFSGCTSLSSITYEGTVERWDSISLAWNWKDGAAIKEVVCSNGTVSLS